jgi:hypothetical protein
MLLLLFPYHVFTFPWYFSSWASGEPHHSGFKSQTVALSLFIIIIIIIIIITISCHRFSFFPGTSPLEPVVNPTTQASSLSL